MMHMRIHGEGFGICCALVSAFLFGIMPFFAQVAFLYGGNAATVACGRFLFGCILCLPFIRATHASITLPAYQLRQILYLSILYAATLVLLFSSYSSIGTGMATALHFIYPIAVLVLAGLLFHTRYAIKHILCIVLCSVGVLLLVLQESHRELALAGTTMAIISGLTYAIYILWLAHSELRLVPIFTITFWLSLFAGVEIGIYAALTNTLTLHMAWQGWIAEGCLGLFSTVLALALFQKSVFLCGELKASLYGNLEPLTGVTIGLLAFHEPMSIPLGIGMACILAATTLNAITATWRVNYGHRHVCPVKQHNIIS